MNREDMLLFLNTSSDPDKFIAEAEKNMEFLDILFETVRTGKSTIRYSCSKTIRRLSQRNPDLIYPYFSSIADWLHIPNSFIRCDSIFILAELVSVDINHLFSDIYEEYFDLIRYQKMVTAANVAGNAWKIVQAVPEWEPDITERLLEVSKITYLHRGEPSEECKNIMYGHVLDCFDHYFNLTCMKDEIFRFAEKQVNNPRKSVAKKAVAFLQKYKK